MTEYSFFSSPFTNNNDRASVFGSSPFTNDRASVFIFFPFFLSFDLFVDDGIVFNSASSFFLDFSSSSFSITFILFAIIFKIF